MRVRSFFFGIKAGGGGFSRKLEDQTDTLLLRPGSRTRAIVKHIPQGRSLLSTSYISRPDPYFLIIIDFRDRMKKSNFTSSFLY
jgi:hypothetical protein